MDDATRIRCEELAKVMKALGHPTRSFLALTLAEGSRCVCELTELIDADISTVSKHLAVLREAGLVYSEKIGLQVHYHLTSPCVLEFYSCVESVVRHEVNQKAALLDQKPEKA